MPWSISLGEEKKLTSFWNTRMCLLMLLLCICTINTIAKENPTFVSYPKNIHIQNLFTFWSKEYGRSGNLTNGNKSSTNWSLSPKRSSGFEFIINSSTTSHEPSSWVFKPNIRIALRTFSSDVTVKSGCCKTQMQTMKC